MKLLKRLFLFFLVLAAVIALASQFLPGHYRVERSIVIGTAPEAIGGPPR